MTALAFEDLIVDLGGRRALDGVSAAIARGGFTAICGPNGAGKTTLLRAALGLVRPTSGQARLDGADPSSLAPQARASRAAYLPQERRVVWGVPALSVVALGALNVSPSEAEARARTALDQVGLATFADRGVFEMSGGERARVLLARLIVSGAPTLLLDEPVAGLDPDAQLLVLDHLRARAEAGATVVTTLHDLSLAGRYAERVLVLQRGRLASDGPPFEALDPRVLAEVFGLDGGWSQTPFGPVLSARRLR
ncbi:MAG: ABC transporter ATP-binding protein [Caulobacteraceae bacterium]|nr:ABC transporter ATP-binding protein [Caulobacteraceae bacterium]